MTEEKIITKIRGLLAKAESTTDEEAALLLDKATELQAKYRIDEAILAAAGEKTADDSVEQRRIAVTRYRTQKGALAVHLARAFDAHVVWAGKTTLEFIGHRTDLDVIEALITSLEIQLDRELLKVKGNSSGDTRSKRANFADGWTSTVGRRIAEHYARAVTEAQEGTSGSVALALIDRLDAVDARYEETYGRRPRYIQHRTSVRSGSYFDGFSAGRRADIGQTKVGGTRGALSA